MALILLAAGCGSNTKEKQPAASIGGGQTDGSAKSPGANSADSDFELKHPQILIETSLGNITIQLDKESKPLTVENFLAYVDDGTYARTIFHQVYKNQAVIAGGYTANLTEIRSRQAVRNEADKNVKNLRGSVAMWRNPDVIDSATSRFFINVADNPALDCRNNDPTDPGGYGYCVFGQVTKGMDVVDRIANTPVKDTDKIDQTPVQTVMVKSVHRVK
jgi:peptidyl-prolyl cis-trans isomerase A (cyclophilin A)